MAIKMPNKKAFAQWAARWTRSNRSRRIAELGVGDGPMSVVTLLMTGVGRPGGTVDPSVDRVSVLLPEPRLDLVDHP